MINITGYTYGKSDSMKSSYILKRTILCCWILFSTAAGSFTCGNRTTVKEHGIFAPSRLESVIGQDGVCSIPFSDSMTFWTFADTITGKWKSKEALQTADSNMAVMDGMLSNSLAWSEKITSENFRNIRLNFYRENGKVAQIIKNRPDENPARHRFWALDGFRSGNRFYVFYLHVYIPDYRKPLGFDVLYTGLARWDIPPGWTPGERMHFRRLGPLFPKGSPCFGAAVMMKDNYVYLAGHYKKNDGVFPLSFTRVSVNDVEFPGKYSFLSGTGQWTADIKGAGAFFGDVSGECSLSFNEFLKEYVVIYSQIFTGDICRVRFNSFATLPFSGKETVYRTGRVKSTGMWPYSAKEIFSEEKSMFLIYIDPDMYQPLLLEY